MNGKNNRVKGCLSRGANKVNNKFPSIKKVINNLNIPQENLNESQKKTLNFFKYNYPVLNKYENYKFNLNTEYATIGLRQRDFDNGTIRITKSGRYILLENIIFNPNEDNDFSPKPEQISSGLYPEMMNGPYHLGFFAAIAVETNDVIIDLNNKCLKQSDKHAFQQRFYSNIELANSPFIPKQGPGDFKGNTTFKSSKNVLIMNGKLERSSHHGIHSNAAENVILYKLDISDFEVAAIALNGSSDSIISDIYIHDNTTDIPLLSTYSQARFIRKHLSRISDDSFINILGENISAATIKNDLISELDNTFNRFKNKEDLPDNIFKNPERLDGYDGNVYGMVLNVNGVVINDFIQERTANMSGNENICLNNVIIKNISSNPAEIIGISDTSGSCQLNEAYGKNVQSGPVGGIIQFENMVENKFNSNNELLIDGKYKPNILSNAQFLVAKYSSKPKVTSCILEWVSEGSNLKTRAIDEAKYYYVSGRDSMSHTMKGNIGLFISGGKNITGKNISISNIQNKATPKPFSNELAPMCPTTRSSQPYVAVQNITVASSNVVINNKHLSTKNLHAPLLL